MPMSGAHAFQHTPMPGSRVSARSGAHARTLAESEFELRRRFALRSGESKSQERVAALLLSISANNGYEGRDPRIIPDTLTSGFVGDLLALDIPQLEDVLVDLERQGLVAATPTSGLVITDFEGLQSLADGDE
jgi:Crp-like helix-turn-helix domain